MSWLQINKPFRYSNIKPQTRVYSHIKHHLSCPLEDVFGWQWAHGNTRQLLNSGCKLQSMKKSTFEEDTELVLKLKNVTICLLMLQSHSPEGVKKMNSAVLYSICDPAIMPPPSLTHGFFVRLPSCLFVSLQVEQLFCLGLRSRSECLMLLEMCDWHLEVASTQMLDNYGSTTRQRYWNLYIFIPPWW